LDLFPEELAEEQTFEWNAKAGRVEGFKRLKYDQLALDEKPLALGDFGSQAVEVLYKQALGAGVQAYCDPDELAAFLNRVKFAAGRTNDIKAITNFDVETTLKELCVGIRSLENLKKAGLVAALRAKLSFKDQSLLERLAPGYLSLPSGRRLEIHYEADKSPWAQSRLQDFFGMNKGPVVAGGEIPVVLHLLSPGKKPVQITSDLAGFWKNHYPQVRKELMRRYPRQKWPENPV
jgi:ATP-dependent helicase HrpB